MNQAGIEKIATGIRGVDIALHGGLPGGRVTLVSGGPGTGKSLLGLEFLYRSALEGHPGLFISFEETGASIRENVSSFGWDFASLEREGKLFIIEGNIDSVTAFSGQFNLKGLLAIIEGKAREMNAERIVIDALDVLLDVFNDPFKEKQQTLVLKEWLIKHSMTAVLTSKSQKSATMRPAPDYLDFMADCVIYLDQRLQDQVNTKRFQILKYRGSSYDTNEIPFLIAKCGMFLFSVSDIRLQYEVSTSRVTSGSPSLDKILGGGFRKGSSILISGETGTGKTSIATTFAHAACQNGQKTLYIGFEESEEGLVSEMNSIGLDLRPAIDDKILQILATIPESMGIEEHLYHKISAIEHFQPEHLVIDAISACRRIAGDAASFDFLMRLIYFCRKKGITILLNNQSKNADDYEFSGLGISSIIDSLIITYYLDTGSEVKRMLHVKKSRGSNHSNKVYHFQLTEKGIQFNLLTPEELTGKARQTGSFESSDT